MDQNEISLSYEFCKLVYYEASINNHKDIVNILSANTIIKIENVKKAIEAEKQRVKLIEGNGEIVFARYHVNK